MNRVICQLALRESGMYVVPIQLLLLGCVLLKQSPLRYFDLPVAVLASLLGFFLAWRVFADYGHVRAFLFSRSFSPARFFLVRWLFGLGTIFITGLFVSVLILCGLRQGVQQILFENGWYPMIRFEEFRVVSCFGIVSLFTFHTTLYFVLGNRFRGALRLRGVSLWLRRIGTVLLILYGGITTLFLLYLGMVDLAVNPGYPVLLIPLLYLICGLPVLLQLLLAPWFGIHCYKNQEIES